MAEGPAHKFRKCCCCCSSGSSSGGGIRSSCCGSGHGQHPHEACAPGAGAAAHTYNTTTTGPGAIHPDFVWPQGQRPCDDPTFPSGTAAQPAAAAAAAAAAAEAHGQQLEDAPDGDEGPPVVDLELLRTAPVRLRVLKFRVHSLRGTLLDMANKDSYKAAVAAPQGQGSDAVLAMWQLMKAWVEECMAEHAKLETQYAEMVARVKAGLQEWGCFQVVNHKVPGEAVEELGFGARSFFNKSNKEKQEAVHRRGNLELRAAFTGPVWPEPAPVPRPVPQVGGSGSASSLSLPTSCASSCPHMHRQEPCYTVPELCAIVSAVFQGQLPVVPVPGLAMDNNNNGNTTTGGFHFTTTPAVTSAAAAAAAPSAPPSGYPMPSSAAPAPALATAPPPLPHHADTTDVHGCRRPWSESITVQVPVAAAKLSLVPMDTQQQQQQQQAMATASGATGATATGTYYKLSASAESRRAMAVVDRLSAQLDPERPTWMRTAIKRYVQSLEVVAATALELAAEAFGVHNKSLFKEVVQVQQARSSASALPSGASSSSNTAASAAGSSGAPAPAMGSNFIPVRVLGLERSPPCPAPGLTWAVGERIQPGALNIVHQDAVGGLQVRARSSGAWVPVKPMPHALVVFAGTMLQAWTDGRIKSAECRAVADQHLERLTMGVSYSPPADSPSILANVLQVPPSITHLVNMPSARAVGRPQRPASAPADHGQLFLPIQVVKSETTLQPQPGHDTGCGAKRKA